MSRNLEIYCNQLATRIQETWEVSVSGDCSRNYRVVDRDDRWLIVYDQYDNNGEICTEPKTHCVVSKETGDVARRSIKLVEEAFFPFNLMDLGSRVDCLVRANYTGDYLEL